MQSIKKVILAKRSNSNVEKKIYTKFFVAFSTRIMFFSTRQRVYEFFLFFCSICRLIYKRELQRANSNRNSQIFCN